MGENGHQQHSSRGQEKTLDMARPCTLYEERATSTCCINMGCKKRKRDRPLGTWRRKVEEEMTEAGRGMNLDGLVTTGLDGRDSLASYAPLGVKRIK